MFLLWAHPPPSMHAPALVLQKWYCVPSFPTDPIFYSNSKHPLPNHHTNNPYPIHTTFTTIVFHPTYPERQIHHRQNQVRIPARQICRESMHSFNCWMRRRPCCRVMQSRRSLYIRTEWRLTPAWRMPNDNMGWEMFCQRYQCFRM